MSSLYISKYANVGVMCHHFANRCKGAFHYRSGFLLFEPLRWPNYGAFVHDTHNPFWTSMFLMLCPASKADGDPDRAIAPQPETPTVVFLHRLAAWKTRIFHRVSQPLSQLKSWHPVVVIKVSLRRRWKRVSFKSYRSHTEA